MLCRHSLVWARPPSVWTCWEILWTSAWQSCQRTIQRPASSKRSWSWPPRLPSAPATAPPTFKTSILPSASHRLSLVCRTGSGETYNMKKKVQKWGMHSGCAYIVFLCLQVHYRCSCWAVLGYWRWSQGAIKGHLSCCPATAPETRGPSWGAARGSTDAVAPSAGRRRARQRSSPVSDCMSVHVVHFVGYIGFFFSPQLCHGSL